MTPHPTEIWNFLMKNILSPNSGLMGVNHEVNSPKISQIFLHDIGATLGR